MTTLLEAAKQALEALCLRRNQGVSETYNQMAEETIANLRTAIEQTEKVEPVAIVERDDMEGWLRYKTIRYVPAGAKLYTAPTIPEGWLRAVDEAMTSSHLGVADASDSYKEAKRKLNDLIHWNIQVNYFRAQEVCSEFGIDYNKFCAAYRAMLQAAPTPEEL